MLQNIGKLPISVILAGCNEAHFLPRCLESILFCDDINYFDLESKDNSIAIAEQFGANIIRHKRVPVVEIIRAEYFRKLKHEWVMIIDPDEQIDPDLEQDIRNLFKEGIKDNVAGVKFPLIFYFKNHRLKGTPWGGVRSRVSLMHIERNILTDQVHSGRKIIGNNEDISIPFRGNNITHHYWMTGYKMLFEKHRRYLKREPETRYNIGKRTTLKQVIKTPVSSFRYAFFTRLGHKDGLTGFFLSLVWTWYETFVDIGLYRYQKKQNKK